MASNGARVFVTPSMALRRSPGFPAGAIGTVPSSRSRPGAKQALVSRALARCGARAEICTLACIMGAGVQGLVFSPVPH